MRACRQAEVKHEETDMAYAAACRSSHPIFISNSIPYGDTAQIISELLDLLAIEE